MSTKKKEVGSSSTRTPGKHDFLNKRLGQESGAAHRLGRRFVMIDLCAGDGAPNEHSLRSSPELMLHHRDYAAKMGWGEPLVILNEKVPNIHRALQEGYAHTGGDDLAWRRFGGGADPHSLGAD